MLPVGRSPRRFNRSNQAIASLVVTFVLPLQGVAGNRLCSDLSFRPEYARPVPRWPRIVPFDRMDSRNIAALSAIDKGEADVARP